MKSAITPGERKEPKVESFDDLIYWFKNRFTHQLVSGSNVAPEIMHRNLAVLEDAVSSYRQAIEYEGWKPRQVE